MGRGRRVLRGTLQTPGGEGRRARLPLPSEAEWEYACRAGLSSGRFHFGDTLAKGQANFGDDPGHPCDVGSYPPNAFGLHDVHGNVFEWCADWFGDYPAGPLTDPTGPARGTYRVFRGGSYHLPAADCRSASRGLVGPHVRQHFLGFRVARVP